MPCGTWQTGRHVRENRNVLTEPSEETALVCYVLRGSDLESAEYSESGRDRDAHSTAGTGLDWMI